MPLAAMLGLCVMLAPSWTGGGNSVPSPAMWQETQPPPDAPPAAPSQEPPKSDQEPKPDQPPAAPATPPPASAQQPEAPQPDSAAEKPAAKPAAGAKTKKSSRKRKPAPQPGSSPAKVVVRNGSTTDPAVQLSPRLSEQQASHQRQNTNQLLATTDANLKKIAGRQLNPGQQDMVNQVRKYMQQSQEADAAGDLQRAHNLAFKAHLLSDDLVKH